MSRRVLVTGGSRGIGRACAERLACDGWQVVVAARGAQASREVVAGLPGAGHTWLELDVGDAGAWERASGRLVALDGVVHAAGVLGPIGPAADVDPEAFADTLRVNVLGTFLAARATLSALDRSGGAFVAFSGGGATGPLPRYDAYAASKAAVVRLIENLAADGLRANAVAPGFVATAMHDATLRAGAERAGAAYFERTQRDLEGGGTSPDVATEMVAWLLSDDSDGISGRLLSAPWDPWRDQGFQARLRAEPNLATLRRIDDQFFTEVPR